MPKSAAAIRLRQRCAPVFFALGDETRLALLAHLGEHGAKSIGALTATTEVSRQAVTKHLHVLQRAGLVRCTEQGRERHYDLSPGALDSARDYLDTVSRGWDTALLRLKAHAERT